MNRVVRETKKVNFYIEVIKRHSPVCVDEGKENFQRTIYHSNVILNELVINIYNYL